jgi:2-methylisocitrate lyase-like PEP mutase family enzyme
VHPGGRRGKLALAGLKPHPQPERQEIAEMAEHAENARRFLQLHDSETPLLLPNPWDLGSARLLAWLGFKALATTSGGHAASLGRSDGEVSREEAVAHAAAIGAATGLPVNGDFENCFADEPAGVAETVQLALDAGIAGCSVEDWSGSEIYDIGLAAERVAAAAEIAHGGPVRMVLTARAENQTRRSGDLNDTIARLQAYQEAGADVLYAPALHSLEEIRVLRSSVDRPINVLAVAGLPPVPELAAAGVSRISVGSAFAFAAYGALLEAATELREAGTYGFTDRARASFSGGAREAFR